MLIAIAAIVCVVYDGISKQGEARAPWSLHQYSMAHGNDRLAEFDHSCFGGLS